MSDCNYFFQKERPPNENFIRRNKRWSRGICYFSVFIKTMVHAKVL